MPFTFSHPAIVLPFAFLPQRYYSLTGLVIGSMAPDFEYFIRMRMGSEYSHTWEGIFYFNLPLSILLAFVFHNIVRNSLYSNLPHFLQKRLMRYTHFNWNKYFRENWLVVVVSIIIGAALHIFWDSFTHPGGRFAEDIPMLRDSFTVLGVELKGFNIVQHLSTIIGGAIVIWAIMKIPPEETRYHKMSLSYWAGIDFLTILIFILRFEFSSAPFIFGNIVVTLISAMLVSLIFISLLYKVSRKN